MNFSEIVLPSNRKFGFFFTVVFFALSLYFYFESMIAVSYTFLTLGGIFLVLTLTNPDLLLNLNKLWMSFGLLIGLVVSPIVLGIIFFGIFMPISLITRLFGRDELRLSFKKQSSYWIKRDREENAETFKNQF